MPKESFSQLEDMISENCPSMLSLLRHIQNHTDFSLSTLKCPSEWAPLMTALASPSPVCGLVHPSQQLFCILQKIQSGGDITGDVAGMRVLQTEIPVLFDLFGRVTHLPSQSLSPVIKELIKKSAAPFENIDSSKSDDIKSDLEKDDDMSEDLSYFPCLPKVRVRGVYNVDSQKRKGVECNKQSSGHPTLLPGIFTVYCPHGELTT